MIKLTEVSGTNCVTIGWLLLSALINCCFPIQHKLNIDKAIFLTLSIFAEFHDVVGHFSLIYCFESEMLNFFKNLIIWRQWQRLAPSMFISVQIQNNIIGKANIMSALLILLKFAQFLIEHCGFPAPTLRIACFWKLWNKTIFRFVWEIPEFNCIYSERVEGGLSIAKYHGPL